MVSEELQVTAKDFEEKLGPRAKRPSWVSHLGNTTTGGNNTTTGGNISNPSWQIHPPTVYSTYITTPNITTSNTPRHEPSLQHVMTIMQAQIDETMKVVQDLNIEIQALLIELRYHKKRADILEKMQG